MTAQTSRSRDGLACIYLHAFLNRALALIAVLCNYHPFAQLFTRYIFLELAIPDPCQDEGFGNE